MASFSKLFQDASRKSEDIFKKKSVNPSKPCTVQLVEGKTIGSSAEAVHSQPNQNHAVCACIADGGCLSRVYVSVTSPWFWSRHGKIKAFYLSRSAIYYRTRLVVRRMENICWSTGCLQSLCANFCEIGDMLYSISRRRFSRLELQLRILFSCRYSKTQRNYAEQITALATLESASRGKLISAHFRVSYGKRSYYIRLNSVTPDHSRSCISKAVSRASIIYDQFPDGRKIADRWAGDSATRKDGVEFSAEFLQRSQNVCKTRTKCSERNLFCQPN